MCCLEYRTDAALYITAIILMSQVAHVVEYRTSELQLL